MPRGRRRHTAHRWSFTYALHTWDLPSPKAVELNLSMAMHVPLRLPTTNNKNARVRCSAEAGSGILEFSNAILQCFRGQVGMQMETRTQSIVDLRRQYPPNETHEHGRLRPHSVCYIRGFLTGILALHIVSGATILFHSSTRNVSRGVEGSYIENSQRQKCDDRDYPCTTQPTAADKYIMMKRIEVTIVQRPRS